MDKELLNSLIDEVQFKTLHDKLLEFDAVEIAQTMEELSSDKAMMVFRLLTKDLAVQVFDHLESSRQYELLKSFTDQGMSTLLEAMPADDRASLLDEVPAVVAKRLLRLLSPEERQITLDLLGYKEGTAGREMNPSFIDLHSEMTAAQALERVRRLATDDINVYDFYIIDNERRLLGTVSLKELALTTPDTRVLAIIKNRESRYVFTYTDREEAAKLMRSYDLTALPVVDKEKRLVGIIAWDDVADIMEEEATEDIYRFGAVPGKEGSYFTARVISVVRRRIVWLILLIFVNTITGSIIAGQEALLGEIVILAAFIPLLIGTGGNVGAQSATVVIRGLATGEIRPRRALAITLREASIGVLLGIIMGLLVLGWAFILGRDLQIAFIVSLTLLLISTMATVVGGILPFIFRLLKLDPALVSAPFITTIMDIFGILVYFLIANMLIRL